MPSTLTFPSTAGFRNTLLARNLSPYTVPGVYTPPTQATIVQETVLRDEGVFDSPDNLIADDPFADSLYPLNAYGPTGGYDKNINVGGLSNTQSNLGPYDITSTSLPQQSYSGIGWPPFTQVTAEQNIPALNKYSFTAINLFSTDNKQLVPTFVPYADPISFVPSYYTPYQIMLQDNPTGSDGTLSQDSFIAQLGAKTLKQEFKERIARNILRNTIGRVNLLNAVGDPLQAVRLLQGKTPIIERDWVITRPSNIILEAADFAARLEGVYFPGSVIPGDYFTTDEHNLSSFGQIASAFNGGKDPRGGFLGKVFGRFLSQKSPSQLFINNTGGGQKSQLYYNLGFNRYSPQYDKGLVGTILDKAKNLFNNLLDKPQKGGYYVGSKELDASRIDSPAGEVPLNPFGQETQSPVYGPEVMAKQYEGDLNFKFGLAGSTFYGGGGLDGGIVWTSPKYNNPGFKANVGGDQGPQDSEYDSLVKSYLEKDLSQGTEFKQSSILDQTQRLLDSTPDGAKRLSHVGNAINQLSKVFNDGYKEITKGSKVQTYVNESGAEVGKEYCRVFTKDTPYYAYSHLQKTDGNIRKFNYSVLDNTFNLNIAPFKSTSTTSSTNIKDGRVKKYMFSLENLAWRTSNRPGLTYLDLPECERGPNGGRIMWFPPYDIKFSETITPQFEANNFLGRPEPIHTYKNTNRVGQLSWSIIVDHPSILNVIVNKELKGKKKELINGIVDSFFAGCKKYDIYELARKYNTIPISELFYMQQIITNPNIKPEDVKAVLDYKKPVTDQTIPATPKATTDLKKYLGIGYYFHNDIPGTNPSTTTTANYLDTYNAYLGLQGTYQSNAGDQTKQDQVKSFFDNVIIYNFNQGEKFLNELYNTFEKNKAPNGDTLATVEIVLDGSASAPNTKAYNIKLSSRRISSVQNYLRGWNGRKLEKYLTSGKLKITDGKSEGESAVKVVASGSTGFGPYNCTDNDPATNKSTEIYTTNAMACRRVVIRDIKADVQPPSSIIGTDNTQSTADKKPPAGYVPGVPVPPTITTTQKIKEGISKKILRTLLSECDYFDMIEEQNPMFYDSIQQQIKYFSPAFHAITPEGLNSRLTFLQQCTRPGDTIPVIGLDGKPKYTNAVNTSFGAPPVLVLRIGDFYNTKIIPTSLNISYEPLNLDLNPEGIGVQPMLAKISMNFNFVGGSGLKEPIDKLQNALSFNYYANTEMYDERADWTDDSFKKIDENLVKAILDSTPVVGVNNVENQLQNEGGNTIGTVQSDKVESDLGASGSTTYQKIMDSLVDGGQKYFDSIINKTEQITKDYNLQLYTAFAQDRKFSDGNAREFTTPKELKIYGKPNNIETKINKLFNMIIADIDGFNGFNDGNDKGLQYIKNLYKENFDNSVIKKVKENLKNTVNKVKSSITTSLTSADNEITSTQLELIRILRKIDIVDTKTDGYIKTDQTAEIYNITATTEVQASTPAYTDTYDELVGDYTKAVDDLYSYYNDLKTQGLVEIEFKPDNLRAYKTGFGSDTCCGEAERRFYSVMSKTILNDNTFQTFITDVIPANIANSKSKGETLLDYTKVYYGNIKTSYKEEYDAEQEFVKKFKDSDNYKNKYKTWTPYPKGKVRKFLFSGYVDGTSTQTTAIQDLYKNGNSNTDDKVFNGKNKFN
jgi:hypothetical protein